MERIICLLIGYICGHFQTAVMYGRIKGIDIRKVGSGNAGTTNTLRVLGPKAGAIVLIGDMLKCIVSIVITYFIFGRNNPDYRVFYMTYAAAGCVLGHDFPLHLKFMGGKGIACTAGYTICLGWKFTLMGLITFFLPLNLTHIVSRCSLCYYTCLFIMIIVTGQMGMLGAMPQSALIEIYVLVGLLTFLAYFQHRGNLKKLVTGKERKTYIFKKNKVD